MAGQARLNEDAQAHLKSLFETAREALSAPLKENQKLISDIYTGRDPASLAQIFIGEQGIPVADLVEAEKTASWRPPQTTANLFLSRVRQLVSNLTPGVPSFRSKARVSGAARLSDDQNKIMRILTDRGDLRAAARRAAFLGLLSPYFGVKICLDGKPKAGEEHPLDQVQFKALEPGVCGYEPFLRRFVWHAYTMQYGDLPATWIPAEWKEATGEEPKPYDLVRVTELYHEGINTGSTESGCPMSVFVERNAPEEPDAVQLDPSGTLPQQDHLGVYATTEMLPACPIILNNFLDAAPDEDIPAAEVLSWIPLMRMIVQTLVQIEREIRTSNNTILYDKTAIKKEVIDFLQGAVPGARVFVPVDADDNSRGVNATMRPVEQNSELDKYLAALSAYLRLFDDVTGVSPSDRGQPAGGRRSAHEAAAITEAAARRTQDRLEVMAGMWTKIAQVLFAYQRNIFGATVEVPLQNGMVETLAVPNPKTAKFAFDVDPVELGHLSNSGDLNAQMQWLTVLTRSQQAFATGMPRMIREALRRLGMTMGIEDVELYLGAPTIEVGPEERFIEHLQTQKPIVVLADDQHDMFMAYYTRMQQATITRQGDEQQILELQQAIDLHRSYAAQSASVINPGQLGDIVPGVGAGAGEVDNNLAAAFATGGAPSAVPQQDIGAGF